MPVFSNLVNFDEAFSKLKTEAIIINDLPNKTEEDLAYFNDLIVTTYTNDTVSLKPTCSCGHTAAEHKIGMLCEYCNTPVKHDLLADIVPLLWFRRPEGVAKLMNPIVWMMLSQRLTKKNYKILNWLTDRTYAPPEKEPDCLRRIKADKIPRGYNHFVENFDALINYLFQIEDFKYKKANSRFYVDMLGIPDSSGDILYDLIQRDRHLIFTDHLPIPTKTLTILDKTSSGRYADFSVEEGKDAINTMLSIDRDHYDQNPKNKENRTARVMAKMGEYHNRVFRTHFQPKEGEIRQSLLVSRTNFSFRAVITSHEDIRYHDEIFAPWPASVAFLRLHLVAKLMDHRRGDTGFSHNEAIEFINGHIHRYHPLMRKLLDEIVRGYGERGIPCLQHRPPTLLPGSSQLVWISRIKDDPMDTTCSVSDLTQPAYNGDYDGDELMHQILLDRKMLDLVYPFRSFFNLLELNKPLTIGKAGSLKDTDVATISNWMHHSD